MSKKQQTNKNYISAIDRKLADFDNTHPRSPAQAAEHRKYQRIYRLRDEINGSDEKSNKLWEQFD